MNPTLPLLYGSPGEGERWTVRLASSDPNPTASPGPSTLPDSLFPVHLTLPCDTE